LAKPSQKWKNGTAPIKTEKPAKSSQKAK
jgi:hypothetical protein